MPHRVHPDVIIVGAGLAGLACAVRLTDAGKKVMILEAERIVGGRTASWRDGSSVIESGLHRWLGFYKALPDLLAHVGANHNDLIVWEDVFYMMSPGQPTAEFTVAPLFKPIETLGTAIRGGGWLGAEDMKQAVKFMSYGLQKILDDPAVMDRHTVSEIFVASGCTSRVLQRIMQALCQGIFFLPMEQFSAYAFFQLMVHALRRANRLRIGSFAGGMTTVLAEPLARYVEAHGGEIVLDTKVKMIEREANGFVVAHKWGELHVAELVLATPLGVTQDLLRDLVTDDPWFAPFMQMTTAPAVSVQLELERPAFDHDRVVFVSGTDIASMAEQSRTTFSSSQGRLSVLMAEPAFWVDASRRQLEESIRRSFDTLGEDLPKIMKTHIVRHAHDFYALAPGNQTKRPPQRTPIDGLYLTGDYTQQSYLATMEGAVVSGNLAAKAVLKARALPPHIQ